MKSDDVLRLLLNLREVKPALARSSESAARVLDDCARCLTRYQFLGEGSCGMFRTSRYTRFSSFGPTVLRKGYDYFYKMSDEDCERATTAFLAQFLFLKTLQPKESLTSFVGQRLKNLGLTHITVESLSSGPVITLQPQTDNVRQIRIPAERWSRIRIQYDELCQSIEGLAAKHTIEQVRTERDDEVFLKKIVLRLSDGKIVSFIDEAVEYLETSPEIIEQMGLIHALVEREAKSLRGSVDGLSELLIRESDEELFLRLLMNLTVFMLRTNLGAVYYIPSLNSIIDSTEVGYAFLVVSVSANLEREVLTALLLLANAIGSLLAIVEQYGLASDAEWRTMFDEIPHTVNTQLNAISMHLEEAKSLILGKKYLDDVSLERLRVNGYLGRLDQSLIHIDKTFDYMQDWSLANKVLQLLSRGEGVPEEDVKTVSIRPLLRRSIETVRDSTALLNLEEKKEAELKRILSDDFVNDFLKNFREPSRPVRVYGDALRILFNDLLKNCLRYCDPFTAPILWGMTDESPDAYRLHFYNNLPLGGRLANREPGERVHARKEIRKLIEGTAVNEEALPFSKAQRIGFRVCRKIVDSLNWQLRVDSMSVEDNQATHLILHIPIGAMS
jgi:hypothetical protein